MSMIDFREIVAELSDSSFAKVKEETTEYYDQFFVMPEEIDRLMYLEKLGTYLKEVERRNNIRDKDLLKIYMDELYPYIKENIEPAGRAGKYVQRLNDEYGSIKYIDDSGSVEALENYTSIYLCLFEEILKSYKKKIDDFDFRIAGVEIDKICDKIRGTKIAKPVKIPFISVPPLKNVIPQGVAQAGDDVMRGLGNVLKPGNDPEKESGSVIHVGIGTKRPQKVVFNNAVEPIHDTLEKAENKSLYSRKFFTVLLLRLMYYRLYDFEVGEE